MCSVATSVVSRQYIRTSDSSRSAPPTWRNPSSGIPMGVSSVRAGKRGRADRPASSTFLQLTARERSAGIAASASNPRPRRFSQSRPQMRSMVRERLRAMKPSSPATASWHISIRTRGILPMISMASSVQSLDVHPSHSRCGRSRRCRRPPAVIPERSSSNDGVPALPNRLSAKRPSSPERCASPRSVRGERRFSQRELGPASSDVISCPTSPPCQFL